MIKEYVSQQSSEIWELELAVLLFFYVLETYTALNSRYPICKHVPTKFLKKFCELLEETMKQWQERQTSLVLSVDTFSVEIWSGKITFHFWRKCFLSFCNYCKGTALSNSLDFSTWLLFSKESNVKMNFTCPAMN